MATIVNEGYVPDRRVFSRRSVEHSTDRNSATAQDARGMQVSWGGVWGGVVIGFGVLLLLTALGLAVGASAFDPGETGAQSVGIGAISWAAVSLLLALYVGGMVSTRIGAVFDKTTGMFEGSLVWVLTIMLIVYLAGSGMGMVAGGAFKLVGGATQAIGKMVVDGAPDLSQGSIDEVVQRLRDPQSARVLVAATGMSREEVQSSLAQIADTVESVRDDPAQAATEVRQGVQDMLQRARADGRLSQAAERAQQAASTTAWIAFGALLLSLLAAIFGSMSGRKAAAIKAGRE